MKYKSIAIPAQDNLSCEMFQRLALSLGYSWPNTGAGVTKVDSLKWVVFDPNLRFMSVVDSTKLDKNDNVIVSNASQLLEALKSPVSQNRVVVNSTGTASAEIAADGKVTLLHGKTKVSLDRELLKLLADELGLTHKAVSPLVKFEYPETARGGLPKIRYVRLVSLDDAYLKGYEVDTAVSKSVGEFKNFVRNRILDGGTVEIVKFSM